MLRVFSVLLTHPIATGVCGPREPTLSVAKEVQRQARDSNSTLRKSEATHKCVDIRILSFGGLILAAVSPPRRAPTVERAPTVLAFTVCNSLPSATQGQRPESTLLERLRMLEEESVSRILAAQRGGDRSGQAFTEPTISATPEQWKMSLNLDAPSPNIEFEDGEVARPAGVPKLDLGLLGNGARDVDMQRLGEASVQPPAMSGIESASVPFVFSTPRTQEQWTRGAEQKVENEDELSLLRPALVQIEERVEVALVSSKYSQDQMMEQHLQLEEMVGVCVRVRVRVRERERERERVRVRVRVRVWYNLTPPRCEAGFPTIVVIV